MNRFVTLGSLAALALASGAANASSIKNTDNNIVMLTVDAGNHKGVLKLLPGGAYDSGGKPVSYSVGNGAPVATKGNDKFIIKGGAIVPDTSAPAAKPVAAKPVAPAATPAAPAAATPAPATATPAAPPAGR